MNRRNTTGGIAPIWHLPPVGAIGERYNPSIRLLTNFIRIPTTRDILVRPVGCRYQKRGTRGLFLWLVIELKKVNEENRNSDRWFRFANRSFGSNRCAKFVQRGTRHEYDCPTYRLQPDARTGQCGRRSLHHASGLGCRKDLVEGAPQSATRTKGCEELKASRLLAVMVRLDAAVKCCAFLHPAIGFRAESRICDSAQSL